MQGAVCLTCSLNTFLICPQVKDQEFPFNRDLARILVAVEDSNDNIPYFTSTVYDAVAFESSPIGTSVIQVTALDKDNGINGQLTYSIEAGGDVSEPPLRFHTEALIGSCLPLPMKVSSTISFLVLCIFRKHRWRIQHQQRHWPHWHRQVPGP